MKSVMISIRPKWCELIASGEKTIEVRKTKPRCEVPFKCYNYCSKGTPIWLTQSGIVLNDKQYNRLIDDLPILLNGKVMGEFICDKIIPISCYASDTNNRILLREQPYTCLTDKQMIDYLGNGVEGYGWHISELTIYDKPKELSEFGLTRPPQSWCYVEEVNDDTRRSEKMG